MHSAAFLDDALRHHATATPHAEAICLLGEVTTYAELETQVENLAAHLTASGVGRGDRVIVCAAKSPALIAALYAVLRVGAAYVPIDPGAPPERLSAQVAAAAAVFAMTDRPRMPRFSDLFEPSDLLDLNTPISAKYPQSNRVNVERSVKDVAYILMTSGTTGTPKGIVHTHQSAMAYVRMSASLCDLRSSDRVSHHTPVHFDMSIFDIFSTAYVGACTVIIPEMHAKLPASLSELIQSQQVTIWYSVPFALIQLVERGVLSDRDLSALRVVMFAGEKMPPGPLKSFAESVPDALFLNAYGPTETNHCTTASFRLGDLDGVSPLPIGAAMDGTRTHIGTNAAELEEGELLIASDQVMREYWEQPDLTDASFCTLSDERGKPVRYYRTGDIVRRDGDGQLLLIGRADRQIKLRGFRIELDEVELALTNSGPVSEAVVTVINDGLFAFVTGSSKPDLEFVRARIAETLPQYAQPHTIEWLEQMPRTSTGKIDRTKLTELAHAQQAA